MFQDVLHKIQFFIDGWSGVLWISGKMILRYTTAVLPYNTEIRIQRRALVRNPVQKAHTF